MSLMEVTQSTLDSLNVEQSVKDNKANLEALGGVDGFVNMLGTNISTGLTTEQVNASRTKFGNNQFPEAPMEGYLSLLLGAFADPTLIVLLCAAAVSLIIGVINSPSDGWIEGAAIFIAVFAVANITAGNDYTKELQFRALESSSQDDERTSVMRNGVIERINPRDLVVGDVIILQAGDQIPADSILVDNHTVKSNESSLTGEADDLKKSKADDCFLLSSCTLTEGEDCCAVVIGIGLRSQWGKIKANLMTEAVNTPLQDRLEDMTNFIGKLGVTAAVCTFIVMVANIWGRNGGHDILNGFIDAFILAVTIIVVAIPEGLPLAVTISLAYSTRKMYKDQCFIRVLAACETMGNATCICSDKTGTLTQNRMTVVEGWFGNARLDQDSFSNPDAISAPVKKIIAEHACLNRTAYFVWKDATGKVLDKPTIVGNKTEGALLMMAKGWGYEYEEVRGKMFDDLRDKVFSFNSGKKRSTAVVTLDDGTVRVFCKGATEWVLKDCTAYLDEQGITVPLTPDKISELEGHISNMAELALRTLLLAHRDFPSANALPSNWMDNPPDNEDLTVDCIVGIIDPLRDDVMDAVATAQRAGVFVRMVTGDNIATAKAIARQCGILTDGIAIEGPAFRKMSPVEADGVLPHVQVMARSSPDDKYLMVTRLNGHGMPTTKEEWEDKMKSRGMEGVTWEAHRDQLLPGYQEEWEASRPSGGHIVGVTGDGTNDAPALKAADVGLAMGITGTKVAQGASDIVILDDRFSSIVKAILWGRSVYDNIRKFLQFQLTVNIVALLLEVIAPIAGFEPPLNAVEMLWVNLVMDTLGALALGTEPPNETLLKRKPYKRDASLISRVMWRNILCQGAFQLAVMLTLLFKGAEWFGVPKGIGCSRFNVEGSSAVWDAVTHEQLTNTTSVPAGQLLTCNSVNTYCDELNTACMGRTFQQSYDDGINGAQTATFRFNQLDGFESTCLSCSEIDYRHNTIIFNAFIWCQIFNEYNSRKFDEWNVFEGLIGGSIIFPCVSIFSGLVQFILVQYAGKFLRTSPLNGIQWLVTIALGSCSLIVCVLSRLIPVEEDPHTFFTHKEVDGGHASITPAPEAPATAGGAKGGYRAVKVEDGDAHIAENGRKGQDVV